MGGKTFRPLKPYTASTPQLRQPLVSLGIQNCYQKWLTPDIVPDYPPTVNALNRHASILCETSSDKELPQLFHKSFESFTASLDAAEFASDFLASPTTPLYRAYYEFMAASEEYVKHRP